MSSSLVSVLHHEERSIVTELRASKPFQRLEAIRRLLALYDVQPSVAAGLDMPLAPEADRATAEVIHFGGTGQPPVAAPPAAPATYAPPPAAYAPPPMASPAPAAAQPTMMASGTIPLPAPAPQVAAMAEAAVADVVMRAPISAQGQDSETSSVVSSVRAALLGIGKG